MNRQTLTYIRDVIKSYDRYKDMRAITTSIGISRDKFEKKKKQVPRCFTGGGAHMYGVT